MNVIELLKKKRASWDHIESGAQAIDDCIAFLEKEDEISYLGDLYRTDYVVQNLRGHDFPLDMLRYTQSWPAREEDVTAAYNSIVDNHQGDPVEQLDVRLTKYHRDPEPKLSNERWESKFGWRVVAVLGTVKL